MLHVYLYPHLPVPKNEMGIITGRTMQGVSVTGRTLGLSVREELSKVFDRWQATQRPFHGVFSSRLTRAVETISLCFDQINIPHHIDDRLAALDYGDLHGRPAKEIFALRPKHLYTPFPGAQSITQMADRHRQFLAENQARFPDGALLCIAHNETAFIMEHVCRGTALGDAIHMSYPWPEKQGLEAIFTDFYGPYTYEE